MKKRNTYVGLILLVAVLMLGIGYAALSNIPLQISGNATATLNDENFKVKFTGTPQVSDGDLVTAEIESDVTKATIYVDSFTKKGDSATATYTILNDSDDLSASIGVPVITNTNEEYFSVTTDIKSAVTVAAKNTTTITVTVELIKTPIDTNQETEITIDLVASPVQPTATPAATPDAE